MNVCSTERSKKTVTVFKHEKPSNKTSFRTCGGEDVDVVSWGFGSSHTNFEVPIYIDPKCTSLLLQIEQEKWMDEVGGHPMIRDPHQPGLLSTRESFD